MNISGAIFDFDGTLFDSMPIWKGLKFEFFESIGLTLNQEDKKMFTGLFLMEALPLAINHFKLTKSLPELYSMFWNMLSKKYLEKAIPKNDIISFLETLKTNGVKMGIATATGEEAIIPVIKKYDMLKYFSSICSTYTVGAGKEKPIVYNTVCKELNLETKTTWIFEDALYAAKTAKNSGYNVVGIFDPSEPNQDDLKRIVDIYINNYNEIKL